MVRGGHIYRGRCFAVRPCLQSQSVAATILSRRPRSSSRHGWACLPAWWPGSLCTGPLRPAQRLQRLSWNIRRRVLPFRAWHLHCTWEASCWEDHVSPSIYVAFKCTQSGTKPCFFWVKRRVTQRSDLDYIAAKDSWRLCQLWGAWGVGQSCCCYLCYFLCVSFVAWKWMIATFQLAIWTTTPWTIPANRAGHQGCFLEIAPRWV